MKFFITGATGLLGQILVRKLILRGDQVKVLTRNKEKADRIFFNAVNIVQGDVVNDESWFEHIKGTDCVINLAGEPIVVKKWTPEIKKALVESRIKSTQNIVKAIQNLESKPSILINSSAIGYYGAQKGDFEITEEHISGKDFLAELCSEWEYEAKMAEEDGLRVVTLRTGIVLSDRGGALQEMAKPFLLYAGGTIGSGEQWVPWIHIDDMIALIIFAIDNNNVKGPLNCVSPAPVKMEKFSKFLAKSLHRPSFMKIPSSLIKIIFGEVGNVILAGKRAIPKKALDNGFKFEFENAEKALMNIYN